MLMNRSVIISIKIFDREFYERLLPFSQVKKSKKVAMENNIKKSSFKN